MKNKNERVFYYETLENTAKKIEQGEIKKLLVRGKEGTGKTIFAKHIATSIGYEGISIRDEEDTGLKLKLFEELKYFRALDCQVPKGDEELLMKKIVRNKWSGESTKHQIAKKKQRIQRRKNFWDKIMFCIGAFLLLMMVFLMIYFLKLRFEIMTKEAYAGYWAFFGVSISIPLLFVLWIILLTKERFREHTKADIIILDNVDKCEWDVAMAWLRFVEYQRGEVVIVVALNYDELNLRYKEKFGHNHPNITSVINTASIESVNLNTYWSDAISTIKESNNIQNENTSDVYNKFLDILLSTNTTINLRTLELLGNVLENNWSDIKGANLNPIQFLIIQTLKLQNKNIYELLQTSNIHELLEGEHSLESIDISKSRKLWANHIYDKEEVIVKSASTSKYKCAFSKALKFNSRELRLHDELFEVLHKTNLIHLVETLKTVDEDKYNSITNDEQQRMYFSFH